MVFFYVCVALIPKTITEGQYVGSVTLYEKTKELFLIIKQRNEPNVHFRIPLNFKKSVPVMAMLWNAVATTRAFLQFRNRIQIIIG